VAAAAFPTFSALAAQEAWDDLQSALIATLRSVLYLTIPATIGLMALGRPIIRLLYERNAFDAASTQTTVWALWFYTLGLVAHSMVEILTRAFYALRNTKIPVLAGMASMGLNILLSIALLNLFSAASLPPHGGIALASSVAVGVEMVWLMLVLRRLPGRLSVRPLGKPLLKALMGGGLMLVAIEVVAAQMQTMSVVAQVLAGISVGAITYGAVTFGLGAEEPRLLIRRVKAYRQRVR